MSLHRDSRGGRVDVAQVVQRQVDIDRAEVLLQPMALGGSGDRHDPRTLSQYLGKSELGRSGQARRCSCHNPRVDHSLDNVLAGNASARSLLA